MEQLSNASTFERTISDAAGMILAVAQQPRFADGAIARPRRGEQIGQTPATPEPILLDRFKSHWIRGDLIHGLCSELFADAFHIVAAYGGGCIDLTITQPPNGMIQGTL